MHPVQFIDHLFDTLFGERQTSSEDADSTAFAEQAVELIVDETHPTIRLLPDYHQRLLPSVRRTITYLREIAHHLPRPFPLSRRDWHAHPSTNAFFATAADVDQVLAHAEEVRDFLAQPGHLSLEHAYALLAMGRHEHSVFGVQLDGEVMRRDVPMRSISFSHHWLTAPGADLHQVRRAIGLRIFKTLAETAMEHILACQARTHDLEEDKALLATRLRQARARQEGLAVFCHDNTPCPSPRELEQELSRLDDELSRARASLTTLEDYTRAIAQVIGEPHQHLGLQPIELNIDRMGRLVDKTAADVNRVPCIEGALTRHGETHPFVLAIACCQRRDLIRSAG